MATTIPVSTIVDVAISVSPVFPARAGFGTLMILTDETTGPINTADRVRTYNNIEGVAEDWASTTEVYGAASTYFSQQPKPTELKVGFADVGTDVGTGGTSAVLTGSVVSGVAGLGGTTNGYLQIEMDGSSPTLIQGVDTSAIDFEGDIVQGYTDLAQQLENALQSDFPGSTVELDNNVGVFILTSGTTGVGSVITAITEPSPISGGAYIGAIMGLEIPNATVVQGTGSAAGTGGETLSDALDDMQDLDQGWYALAVVSNLRNADNSLELAGWCEARIKIFMCCSNDADILDATITDDIASVLKSSSYRRTTVIYSSFVDQYPEVSVFARAATVNFNQPDSTITLKFKQLPTITTESLRQSQKATLDSKNANALITVGDSIMFAESYMANGVFFDEVHGLDWLQNAIQTNVFGYLYTKTTKVPYTDKGVAAIEQQVTDALNEGVRNGLLAPGETIEGEYLPLGYSITTLPVADINQSDVEARCYPGLSFVALGAGAIHKVQINGVFER